MSEEGEGEPKGRIADLLDLFDLFPAEDPVASVVDIDACLSCQQAHHEVVVVGGGVIGGRRRARGKRVEG